MTSIHLNINDMLEAPTHSLEKLRQQEAEKLAAEGKKLKYGFQFKQTYIYWHYVNYFIDHIQALIDKDPELEMIVLAFDDTDLGWEERLVYRASLKYGEIIYTIVDEQWNSKFKKLFHQREAALMKRAFSSHNVDIAEE